MNILIAEDSHSARSLLESYLVKWGYSIRVAEDGAQAWQMLQAENAPRLALLDWMMPRTDGVEVCRRVRRRVGQPYTYIILLTAKISKMDVIAGLESGADDYLTKPFHPRELQARLRVGKRILELEDNLLAARDALKFKATHDALTGLWNRAEIIEKLYAELARARRERGAVGILLADLDHFKSVNDTYGHLAGDEVLREAARRLTAAVRFYDAVGRYGGEEFLIVMPGCDHSAMRQRAEQVRKAIGGVPADSTQGTILVTVSLGAVSSVEWENADADVLLRAADEALYRAKQMGRNRVEVGVPGELGAALHKAAEEHHMAKPGKL